jgi:hypothetical protein
MGDILTLLTDMVYKVYETQDTRCMSYTRQIELTKTCVDVSAVSIAAMGPAYVLKFWQTRGHGMSTETLRQRPGSLRVDVYDIAKSRGLPREGHGILDEDKRKKKRQKVHTVSRSRTVSKSSIFDPMGLFL